MCDATFVTRAAGGSLLSPSLRSGFPYVKMITPENMVGYSEFAKVAKINKVFEDAYKSPQSVIVIDEIERLLDYVPMGQRSVFVLLLSPPYPLQAQLQGTTAFGGGELRAQRGVLRGLMMCCALCGEPQILKHGAASPVGAAEEAPSQGPQALDHWHHQHPVGAEHDGDRRCL